MWNDGVPIVGNIRLVRSARSTHDLRSAYAAEQTQNIPRVLNMAKRFILASGSDIRASLLRNAGIAIEVQPARIDEDAVKAALLAEEAKPRDIADTLAEYKALRVANANLDALVLGCDQIVEFKGELLSKPETPEDARGQLARLSGATHRLLSAAVLYENGEPVWRHVGVVRMTMRDLSPGYIDDYVNRNWHSIRSAVGGYKLEEEGVRLFSLVDGDYFHVLGLPLTELLSYLIVKGEVLI